MARNTWNLEYDCPQYVNFAVDLDKSSENDEVFFDCGKHSAPMQNEVFKSEVIDSDPVVVSNGQKAQAEGGAAVKITETFEDFLVSKMMAGLAAIENAPKAARMHRELMEKTPVPKPAWNCTPKICKKETGCALKIAESKSINDLRQIGIKPANAKGLRKRSSSLNDLSPMRLVIKKTNPGTPMCLKRSLSKSRKVIKSTEEIELEKISKLQEQMKQHLRYNELSLKKLNLKPREGTIPKRTWSRPLKVNHAEGFNPPAERIACPNKDKRVHLPELSKEALKKKALEAEAFVKEHKPRIVEIVKKEDSKIQQKQALLKRIGFHSGLRFHETVKKTTQVKPFNFCTKPREMKMQATGVSCIGKENVDTPRKMSEKREAARRRGLSENIARN